MNLSSSVASQRSRFLYSSNVGAWSECLSPPGTRVAWKDCSAIGNLLGTRLVTNEFVAFVDLGNIKGTLDPKSFIIATYALCGFANFSSIAIQIGGIGGLAPSRKSDLARLGLRAVAAGTMANFMSACIAGMIL